VPWISPPSWSKASMPVVVLPAVTATVSAVVPST
jgi:hypothetical protein